jgi:hypothetical protein
MGGTVQQATVSVTAYHTYQHIRPDVGFKEVYGKYLDVYAKASGVVTFQIQYALNYEDTFHTLYEWTLEGQGYTEHKHYDLPEMLRGKAIQWRIQEAGAVDFDWEKTCFIGEQAEN